MKGLRGYLFIIGAAACWGISATFAKFLFTTEINVVVLTQSRVTISFLIFLVVFLLFRRDLLIIRAKDLYKFILLGLIGGAGSTYFYYFTINETNVATAILLQYLAPLFVLAYAGISHEEHLTWLKIFTGVLSLTGCVLAIGGKDFSILTLNSTGLISGLLSALCWGFTNIWLRNILKSYTIWTALVYSFFFASMFWMIINPPWNIVAAHYSAGQWEIFILFAVISILIPHSLYFAGIRYLTASTAIITATIEPVIAIVSAYIVLKEQLTPVQFAGAALVIVTIVVLQRHRDPVEELQP